MVAKQCKTCGAPLPLPSGRGRPRTRCQSCAPSVKRNQSSSPPVVVPGAGVAAATLAELEAAGMADSQPGRSALALARAIDSGDEHGASLAALVKQLLATMHAAVGDQEPAVDPIQLLRDDLAARRDSRTG